MGVLDTELSDMDINIKNAQTVKNTVLDLLAKNEIINDEEYQTYLSDYQIILIKKSWWINWKDIFGKDSSPGYYYRFVKIN